MRLKELRNNISQTQLAKALGIPQTTYSNYERGDNEPDIKTLCKIADYYGVSLDYLCEHKNPNTREIGYLDEKTLAILKLTQELTDKNKDQAFYYISGLVAGQ